MTIGDLRLILAALAVAVARAAFVLVAPTRKCGRCHGRRTYRKGNAKRLTRCTRCRDGRVYRLGAVTVHRFWKSAVTDRWLEKQNEAIKAEREESRRV
jgi:hypothetical protein